MTTGSLTATTLWQGRGVRPDLTTLGKAIANGFPLAAIAGRRELLSSPRRPAGRAA